MTANDVLQFWGLTQGRASKRDILDIARRADECGLIQEGAARQIWASDHPERWTTASVKDHLIWLGCVENE